MSNFFKDRNLQTINKINDILLELPEFILDFFIGIEHNTTPLTRLNYAYDLRIFFGFLISHKYKNKKIIELTLADLDNLDVFYIEKYISYLSLYEFNGKVQSCNARAKSRKLSSVRSLYKYFFNKGLLTANTAAKVAMPKINEKEIVRLESNDKVNEISQLLNSVESGSGLTDRQRQLRSELTKARDFALLALFLGTGIRISELVGLNENDLDFKNNSFKVTRKGGNRTILYFSDEISGYIKEYLNLKYKGSGNYNKNDASPPLFESSISQKRLSVRAIQELVKKYARPVTPLKNITPHKLRSTFGTQLYRATGDIYFVADVLGHKDVNTTKKHYAAISDDTRRQLSHKIKLRD